MKFISILGPILALTVATTTVRATNLINAGVKSRSFTVDYENNQFAMDGRPFKYVSGSFHYFRALSETWRTKLRTMRAAGLNAVSTYVEWSLHNPHDNGEYNFEGIANLEKFVEDAQAEGLYVILRPGPYICAEREMGGLPYWLLHKYPGIKLRTNDSNYLAEVEKWFNVLMPRIKPLLYGNGGPIIMVQVENEYGSFPACDHTYGAWLRDEMNRHVENAAVLFTTDGPSTLNCGKIDKVLATIDFGAIGIVSANNTAPYWAALKQVQPNGPLVNSEFYAGWLTHWQEYFKSVGTTPITQTLRNMLEDNVSVNFYMFFGGTNFGFTAGANNGGRGKFNAVITSYDYDAPMNEAGDPTPKYMAIRDVIKDFFPLPNISVPIRTPKSHYGTVGLRPLCTILSDTAKSHIAKPPVYNPTPLSFEQLNQYSGFVLYETNLPQLKQDPIVLQVKNLRDRAFIYIDNQYAGILSRENVIEKMPLSINNGRQLQILVENQGRINYNIADDYKGILGAVKLGNRKLSNWTMTGYPLDNYEAVSNLIQTQLNEIGKNDNDVRAISTSNGPVIYYGEFEIHSSNIYDTYLDPTGWAKGIAFVNGFNLGRYWPVVGPQVTLYVPKELLKQGTNVLVILEYQSAPQATNMLFVSAPKLDIDI